MKDILLYSVYKDPFYVIGQRAAIKYRAEEEGNTGNPHIFSKVAFFGFILSTILLKNLSKFRVNILIPIGLLLIFVVVLFLTQTMITFLTTAIFLFLFFIFNFNLRSIYRSVLALLLKWYVLAILIFGVYKVSNYLKDNEDALKPATTYISNRIEKVAATVFGGAASKEKKEKKVDESAVMRVQLVTEVFIKMEENFEEGKIRYILFGNGYKSLYVDVPIFEALDSFGFFMFLFYLLIYSYLSMMCLKEMKNPRSIATEFIAYGFIYFMIQNLTGGLLMDFNRWGYYALVARFLVPIGYKVSENFKESKVSTLSNLN
jgi:hypothetical protein